LTPKRPHCDNRSRLKYSATPSPSEQHVPSADKIPFKIIFRPVGCSESNDTIHFPVSLLACDLNLDQNCKSVAVMGAVYKAVNEAMHKVMMETMKKAMIEAINRAVDIL